MAKIISVRIKLAGFITVIFKDIFSTAALSTILNYLLK